MVVIDENLQKLYSPSLWNKRMSPNDVIIAHGENMSRNSDSARKNLKSYIYKFSDDEDEETSIEFYYNDNDSLNITNGNKLSFNNKKIFIYLHGGYWQWGSVKSSSFMAENFAKKGIITAAVGYSLAPKVTMTQLVEQVERGVAKVLEFAKDSEVFICGHSAGGHLAAMILFTDFKNKYNVDSKCIKGIIPVSGVFDLSPILKTDVNDNLKMDLDEAIKLSPLFKKTCYISEEDRKNFKIFLAYGEEESTEFKIQSIDFLNVLKNEFKFFNLNCIQINNTDHFNVIENLSLEDYDLAKEIFKVMEIN